MGLDYGLLWNVRNRTLSLSLSTANPAKRIAVESEEISRPAQFSPRTAETERQGEFLSRRTSPFPASMTAAIAS